MIAYLAPLDLYIEPIKRMTAICPVTALPKNNIAIAMPSSTFPTNDDLMVYTNRKLAFDINKVGM